MPEDNQVSGIQVSDETKPSNEIEAWFQEADEAELADEHAAKVQELDKERLGQFLDWFIRKCRPLIGGVMQHDVLRKILTGYEQSSKHSRQLIIEWLKASPASLWAAALHLFRAEQEPVMRERFMELSPFPDLLLVPLQDPNALSRKDAIEMATELGKLWPKLSSLLLSRLPASDNSNDPDSVGRVLRTLELVEAITEGKLNRLPLVKLQRFKHPSIQSKITLLLARRIGNVQWLEVQLEDPNPRLRANAVEGLWNAVPTDQISLLLWNATKDKHPRVACNALIGLVRMQHLEAFDEIEKMASHASPGFRASAAWMMGELGDPRFCGLLREMVRKERGNVRRNATRALMRIRRVSSSRQSENTNASQGNYIAQS